MIDRENKMPEDSVINLESASCQWPIPMNGRPDSQEIRTNWDVSHLRSWLFVVRWVKRRPALLLMAVTYTEPEAHLGPMSKNKYK